MPNFKGITSVGTRWPASSAVMSSSWEVFVDEMCVFLGGALVMM